MQHYTHHCQDKFMVYIVAKWWKMSRGRCQSRKEIGPLNKQTAFVNPCQTFSGGEWRFPETLCLEDGTRDVPASWGMKRRKRKRRLLSQNGT
jgi:hypothetical protein